MRSYFTSILNLALAAMVTVGSASLCLGQVTNDRAAFEAECADAGLVTETFEGFTLEEFIPGISLGPIDEDLTLANSTLSVTGDPTSPALTNIDSTVLDASVLPFELLVDTTFASFGSPGSEGYCVTFDLTDPSTHFGLDILANDGVSIEFFDAVGAAVGVSEAIPNTDQTAPGNNDGEYANDAFQFFGFVAPAGTTFSSVKITAADGSTVAFDNVSTGNCPQVVTCFDQLTNVKIAIADLMVGAQGVELKRLQYAFDCVCIIQNPVYWEGEDRLSRYGGNLFIGGAYTIAYLEWSGSTQVDPIIEDLLSTLNCIVDNEIAYAIANDGDSCLIENAEAYADVGDWIYEDFDLPVLTALVYRLAWLNAFYATN